MEHPLQKKRVAAILISSLTLLFAACLLRTCIGFDWSDEAYYTALPYRYAIGDKLFLDGWEIHQLSVMFTLPLIRVFLLLSGGDTTGIMLYMRLLFVLFQYGTALFLFFSLRNRFGQLASAVLAGTVLLFSHFGLPNFSYDSLVILFTFWSLAFLVRAQDGRLPHWTMLLSGLFYAFAVQSYPQYAVTLPFFLMYFLLGKARRDDAAPKRSGLLFFLLGIFLAVLLFLAFVLTHSSIAALLDNLPYLLSDPTHEKQSLLLLIREYLAVTATVFFWPLLAAVALFFISLLLRRFAAPERMQHFRPLLLASAAFIAVLLIGRVLLYDAYWHVKINFLCMPLAFMCPTLLLLLPKKDLPLPALLFCLGVGLSLAVHLLGSNMGLYASSFPLLIASAGTVLAASLLFQASPIHGAWALSRIVSLCCACLLIAGFAACRLLALYRTDGTIGEQTQMLSAGPAKGIRVTGKSRDQYDALMRDIAASIGEGPVLFARSLPFGYLCVSRIGTPSVWSVSPNTERAQEYYRLHEENIPETIFLMDLDFGYSNVTRDLDKLFASFPEGYAYSCTKGESCLIYRRIDEASNGGTQN